MGNSETSLFTAENKFESLIFTNSGITEEKVKNYLKRKLKDGDWYLDPHEAVFYGFADCVLTTKKCPTINSVK